MNGLAIYQSGETGEDALPPAGEDVSPYCGTGPVEFRTMRVARSRMEPMDT